MYDTTIPRWLNYSKAFIDINDLDPVYVAVHGAYENKELDFDQACNFLTMMSTFYSIGESCTLVHLNIPSNQVWDYMLENYTTLKRGTERRYFRGEQGLRCLNYLKEHYKTPQEFVMDNYRPTYVEVCEQFARIPAFGPYHIWKWLDFYDRILGLPVQVEFNHAMKVIPAEPIKGAKKVSMEVWGEDRGLIPTVEHMFKVMRDRGMTAPPMHDRLVDVQEIETCLCMINHMYAGQHIDYVGKDLLDKYESVKAVGVAGEFLLKYLPKPVPKNYMVDPFLSADQNTNNLLELI